MLEKTPPESRRARLWRSAESQGIPLRAILVTVAVAIVTFWAVLIFIGLAIAFGLPLVNSGTHLADRLPTYVDQAQHGRGWIGQLIRRYHVTSWVQHNSAKITNFAQGLGKPALALGKGA